MDDLTAPRFSGRRQWLAWFLLLLLAALLVVPSCLAFRSLGQDSSCLPMVVATLGLLVLLARLLARLPLGLAVGVGSVSLIFMLLTRFTFYGVATFSGQGFSDEFFIHLEPRSVVVSWEQYRALWLLLFGTLACVPAALVYLLRRSPRLSRPTAWGALVLAILATGLAGQALPEWLFARAAWHWYQPKSVELSELELQRWEDSEWVSVQLSPKGALRASLPDAPRNLVLIYLESLGRRVIEHPDHPGLMPYLAGQLRQNSLVDDYFAASYITIEGIANSQCGTLIPFERGSDSMAGFDNLAENQACLADVLQRAGYEQHYLGGAETEFAGKGAFLLAHGYDSVMGFREWRDLGYAPRPGGWGLGDPDLFNEAFDRIRQLHALGRPFNVTLLTLGSHLPGFYYEECAPYSADADEFINALHCTDQLLEKFVTQLEAAGILEDTVVVITADHHVFPNQAMKRLFGTEAIEDRRLPFLVLGPVEGLDATPTGASYDLAPTVLDLLGITSNAEFALGRSLLRPEAERDYFLTRYADVFDREYVEAGAGQCSIGLPELPLNLCDKAEALTILRAHNAAFSKRDTAPLSCDQAEVVEITVPHEAGSPIRIRLNGSDHAFRFTWQSRPYRETQFGLFAAAFAEDGQLVERLFVPQQEAVKLDAPPRIEGAHHYVLAWRSHGGLLPRWLQGLGTRRATAALMTARGGLFPLDWRRTHAGDTFSLTPDACRLWSGTADGDDQLQSLQGEAIQVATQQASQDQLFCPISNWGSQETRVGQRFNEQPDGRSAFWLETECAPISAELVLDGKPIETVHRLPIMTGALDADPYLQQPGEWPLELWDPLTGERQAIGTFRVLPMEP